MLQPRSYLPALVAGIPALSASCLVALALSLAATGMALASPFGAEWSDSQILVRNASASAKPYYNVAYLPLANAFQRILGWALGTGPLAALQALSAIALGTAAALSLGALRRARLPLALAALLAAIQVASPGAFFHASVVEVHTVALAGGTLALWLVVRARELPSAHAFALALAACAIAVGAHLSHVLLAPGIVFLARGTEPGRGVRFGPRMLFAGIVLLGGLTWLAWLLVSGDPARWDRRGGLMWIGTLVEFTRGLGASRIANGWFTPGEMAHYIDREALAPQGVLMIAPLAVLVAWRGFGTGERRLVLDSLPWLLVPTLVLAQGGVLERGGYLLLLGPVLALWLGLALRGRRLATALLVTLLAAQVAWTTRTWQAYREVYESPRAFAERVAAECTPGDRVMVATLGKYFALRNLRPDLRLWDLERELALCPEAARESKLLRSFGARLVGPPGTSLRLDPALLSGDAAPSAREPLTALLVDDRLRIVEEPGATLLRVEPTSRGTGNPEGGIGRAAGGSAGSPFEPVEWSSDFRSPLRAVHQQAEAASHPAKVAGPRHRCLGHSIDSEPMTRPQ